jgi:DNA-binding HxlR family transcriptional regulator
MGSSYHQFWPVAKAMELLDERWTLLVLRELINDSRRFNDLRRSLPTMSPTLLSKRLQQLVRAGLVTRTGNGQEVEYRLRESGGRGWLVLTPEAVDATSIPAMRWRAG